jgi:hypothetical protein
MSARVSWRSMAGSTRISIPTINSHLFGAAFGVASALPRCEGAEILAAEPPEFGYDATAFRSGGATLRWSMVDARERPSCPLMRNGSVSRRRRL